MISRNTFQRVGFLAGILAISSARADVRLPALFSDNVVLQQGGEAPVWGWADEGEEVKVTFRGKTVKARAKDGKWKVELIRLKAGGPDNLVVEGKNRIELKNVLVGEVWICSGQSNMEWPMKSAFERDAAIAASSNPQLRLFLVPKTKADEPRDDVKADWKDAGPESTPNFSAVAYYFGRDLQKALKVPVGLIETCWGGSPAEVWMSRRVLEANPEYKRDILDTYPAAEQKYKQVLAAYRKQKADAEHEGKEFTNAPPWQVWKPTELYNGMIAPVIPFAIKGAIWYQGESNAGRAEQYRRLFVDMIKNWRHDWGEGSFPFLEVQLAPFVPKNSQPGTWPELREAQVHATKVLPKVGIAVITDVGEKDDIHPTKKEPVGARLALAARAIAYGDHIVYSGPMYKGMKVRGDKAIIRFKHVGSGLVAKDGELKGFTIAGEDRKFVPAQADIEGNTVVVHSPEVAKPVAVRYGWEDYPVVNLWNKDGLPASPFRTDNFPMITAGKK